MTPQPAQSVYAEIVAHIGKQGGTYSSWYCGIASDGEDSIFKDHQVPKKGHWYIARQCYNAPMPEMWSRLCLSLDARDAAVTERPSMRI